MRLSNEQKQQLADYIASEIQRTQLSERELASRMGLSYAALQKWRRKSVNEIRSGLELLSNWRKKNQQFPSDVTQWLQGIVEPSHQISSSEVLYEVRTAIHHSRQLYVSLTRLAEAIGENMKTDFGEFIESTLENRRVSLDEFSRLAHMSTQDMEQALYEEPTETQLAAIARGLNAVFDAAVWTPKQLTAIAKRSAKVKGKCRGETCCTEPS